eukprot:symbB.v1.2.012005.t1/scaffold769.1/size163963/9
MLTVPTVEPQKRRGGMDGELKIEPTLNACEMRSRIFQQRSATRQLSQYVARARRCPARGPATQGEVDLRYLLQQRVTGLAEELMKQDVELQELRRRSGEVPVEVHQLQEENALLARRGAQILEEAAQLSSKRGSLEEQQQQKVLEVQQLQQEKDSVRQQVDAAHSREAAARNVQESALKALDLERRRSQDLAKTLKAALQQRHLAAEEAEKKALDAEREVANLEADSVGHSQVVEAEHVAEAESLRRQQRVEHLELELEQAQSQRSEEAEELQQRQRKDRAAFAARETQQKLVQAGCAYARVEARRLEDAAQQLAKQLAESEQKAEESDRKAMAVAKELAETLCMELYVEKEGLFITSNLSFIVWTLV